MSFRAFATTVQFTLGCCVAGGLLLAPKPASAQKIASYDYSNAKTGERLRPPVAPAAQPSNSQDSHRQSLPPAAPIEFSRGVCGGILGNPILGVSILSLDRDSYVFGDEFTFVLQVKALYPTRVPVRATLAEIEPSDPTISYKWRPMGITMELRSLNHRTIWIGLLQLYGSKDAPGSEIELKAGEWIEFRGKARMEWNNPPAGTLRPEEEKWVIRVPLRDVQQFTGIALAHRAGSYFYNAETRQEIQACDYPGEQSGSGEPIPFTIAPQVNR